MKILIFSIVFALLAIGNTIAAPQFRGLNNNHGKTTVKIEIPFSELTQTTVIRDWKLYNNGKVYTVKNVKVERGSDGDIFVLEFTKLKKFSDCKLSFTVNDEPVNIDIQSLMNR